MSLLANAKWNSFSQFFKIGIQLVNIVYLAKLIPPAEYGLMAMALVVLNMAILLRDLGTSAAIIQRKELTNSLINTVFWLNTFMGLALAVIVVLASPVIAEIYHQPKLIPVLMLLSITFPLSSCAAAHLALLERDSKFKKISGIEISSSMVSVIVAVVLANLGYGVYSLVFQAITLNLMSAIQFWLASSWRPFLREFIKLDELKSIFGFSANLSFFNFVNYFSRNADSFIIGKFMSVFILGNYSLAYRIMLFPLQSLTFIASRSLYPVLSRSQDNNADISKTYLNCVFVILLITAPLMSGLALLSKPFVLMVFGQQWSLVGDILKCLAPTAIIQSVLSTTGSVFMAKGRTDILMKLGIIGTILQVGAFLIGVHFDIITFALLYFVANVLNALPVMYCLLKLINSNFKDLIVKIAPVVGATIVMVVAMKFTIAHIGIDFISTFPRLISFSLFGGAIYFLSIAILSTQVRGVIKSVARKKYS
ncbi:MOP flippase family protein [Rouxiella badensis]|uniref:MOP flippase family protein n=1 Tax=Rouxiella badensis TaxID=1646377 RepID=UPI001D13C136|nr:MOP flippase family protein [Rouxiella badensis]MCC3719630.1 MOP flippase family protein [Rouxiella badensis]MCC3728880.1 MOP flippase family protein [Rouxiella badensis]MCC3740924.1 MOP flippase family protein [Rouxiella badensis]